MLLHQHILDHIAHHDDSVEVHHLDDDFLVDEVVDEVDEVDDKIYCHNNCNNTIPSTLIARVKDDITIKIIDNTRTRFFVFTRL